MKFPAFEPIDLKNGAHIFEVEEILLTNISPDPNQPRKTFDPMALEELASSIKQHGIIQPIIVKQLDTENYQIIAGERRWRAAKAAGLTAIPVIIKRDNEEQKNLAISLIENIQREELNPIELAESFRKLNRNFDLSHEEIATMIGKSRTTVTNLLRLLNLSKEVQKLLEEGLLEMGHARALLVLDPEQQVKLAQEIIINKLTVRDVERIVQLGRQDKIKKASPYEKEVSNWVNKLSSSVSAKVSVNINERGEGKVVIHFTSPAEIDWLVDRLENKVH
jgi:ParB family chromosome partitioning protein